MTIDPTFTANTEIRTLRIETALSDLWRLMRYVVNKGQFNSLRAIRQMEYDALIGRVVELETEYQELYDRVNNLL